MNFNPYALLVTLILIVVTAAGTIVHGKAPQVVPSVSSWSETSVPMGTVYSVATTSMATSSSTLGKASDTLPAFTFATNEAVHAALSHISGGSSASASDLYTYLGSTRTNTVANSGASNPIADFRSGLSYGSAVSTTSTIYAPSPEKDALHAYGNAAGMVVHALETANANENADLTAFFTNPTDATAAPVIVIAEHLASAGAQLHALSSVPSSAAAKNEALASAYADTSAKLSLIAAVRKNEDFKPALDTYQKSIEGLGASYVSLVLLFQEQRVSFANAEDGSVFTFSGSL